ncbi:MAG: heme biosynthesis HemY N-terminal domain-containing protein [Pseudomonadota bacterium]
MIVLFLLILLVVVAGLFVLWASRLPGGLTIDLGNGAAYEFELVYALLAILLLGAAMALIWSMLSGLVRFPARFSRARRAARTKAANKALADGLLAADAGDVEAARKLSKKAAAHAEDDRLKLLLEARTAEISDDWASAERVYGQMALLPGAKLAGLRGAAAAAGARGDHLSAESRAREALALKSGADWPFTALFDSQVASGDWSQALDSLSLAEKQKYLDAESLRRRRAVLYTAQAVTADGLSRKEAQRLLAEAIRCAPGFPAAVWHGARHLFQDGKHKAAQNVLDLGWKAQPHPALAELIRRQERIDVPAMLSALVRVNPDHRESRILQAEHALAKAAWPDAVKALAILVEEKPTARLSLMLEQALRGYGDMAEADRWARMALTAPREPEWSDLDPRGNAFAYTARDWARMVYSFGDAGNLIHPRYERAERELAVDAVRQLPAPDLGPPSPPSATSPPLDYASDASD